MITIIKPAVIPVVITSKEMKEGDTAVVTQDETANQWRGTTLIRAYNKIIGIKPDGSIYQWDAEIGFKIRLVDLEITVKERS